MCSTKFYPQGIQRETYCVFRKNKKMWKRLHRTNYLHNILQKELVHVIERNTAIKLGLSCRKTFHDFKYFLTALNNDVQKTGIFFFFIDMYIQNKLFILTTNVVRYTWKAGYIYIYIYICVCVCLCSLSFEHFIFDIEKRPNNIRINRWTSFQCVIVRCCLFFSICY